MTVKVRRCIRIRNRYRSLPESYRRCDLQYGVKPTLDMLCASQPKHDQMLDCALDCDAKIPRTWPSCNTDGTNSAEHVHRETEKRQYLWGTPGYATPLKGLDS